MWPLKTDTVSKAVCVSSYPAVVKTWSKSNRQGALSHSFTGEARAQILNEIIQLHVEGLGQDWDLRQGAGLEGISLHGSALSFQGSLGVLCSRQFRALGPPTLPHSLFLLFPLPQGSKFLSQAKDNFFSFFKEKSPSSDYRLRFKHSEVLKRAKTHPTIAICSRERKSKNKGVGWGQKMLGR